jgi:hypothetical protein
LINRAGAGFFATLGVPFLAGRDFDDRDTPNSVTVAIVNERFAAKFGGSAAAVGNGSPARPRAQPRAHLRDHRRRRQLDLRDSHRITSPSRFYADSQDDPADYAKVMIRSAIPAEGVTPAITAALADLDRGIEVRYSILPTMIRDTLVQERVLAQLSGGFGALAALLTMVGLYGLVAYSVSRRTGEIGISRRAWREAPRHRQARSSAKWRCC